MWTKGNEKLFSESQFQNLIKNKSEKAINTNNKESLRNNNNNKKELGVFVYLKTLDVRDEIVPEKRWNWREISFSYFP